MTIREELERLGPEIVRRGMVAFEHRGNKVFADAIGTCPDNAGGCSSCCFLQHAVGSARRPNGEVGAIENAFEGWKNDAPAGSRSYRLSMRHDLFQECIAFLAEHGSAPETVRWPDAAQRSSKAPEIEA